MAISPLSIDDIIVTPGVSVTVAPALENRHSLILQFQAPGRAWLGLDEPASPTSGIRIGSFQQFNFDIFYRTFKDTNRGEFYEGSVDLFWEGGTKDGVVLTSAIVHVTQF